MLDFRALTKIQSLGLIAGIVIATLVGSGAYILLNENTSSAEPIKIGVCGDLDMPTGKAIFQGAVLAAEQINEEGGLLGRNLTVVAEDDDSETPPSDLAVATNALTKLITVDKADFVIFSTSNVGVSLAHQDVCSQQKEIVFSTSIASDNMTKRVLNDYEKYKYYFRVSPANITAASIGMTGDILTCANYTGFKKVAILGVEATSTRQLASYLNTSLPAKGLEVVYMNFFPISTSDFTSYLAAVEESGAEILAPVIIGQSAFSFVKEWYNRESPYVVWGTIGFAQENSFWQATEGKCEFISFYGTPVVSGYPLTSKTAPTYEAYLQRWNEIPKTAAGASYDVVRFILHDAIKRAGTIETENLIKSLEATDVETSSARHFVFTTTHDTMIGPIPNKPGEDYLLMCVFQWQDGKQVPVYPPEIMNEAGASYKYPPWNGPWSTK